MKTEALASLPKARSEGIITKEVDGEVLVYDLNSDKAHCLNETSATIWQLCDGVTSIADLTRSVSESMGAPVSEIVVQLALKQLSANQLLTEGYEVASLPVNLSRRSLVRRLGLGVALLPLITSLSAPTALAAVSCGGACGPTNPCPAGCTCSPVTNRCRTT